MSETNTQKIEKLANELADVTARLKLLESSQHVLTTAPAGMSIEPYKSHAFAHLEDLIPLIKAINSGGGASYELEQRVDLLESGQHVLTSAVAANELAISGLESGQNILTSAVRVINTDAAWVDVTDQVTFLRPGSHPQEQQYMIEFFKEYGSNNYAWEYSASLNKLTNTIKIKLGLQYTPPFYNPGSMPSGLGPIVGLRICKIPSTLLGHSAPSKDNIVGLKNYVYPTFLVFNLGDYTQKIVNDFSGQYTGFESGLGSSRINVTVDDTDNTYAIWPTNDIVTRFSHLYAIFLEVNIPFYKTV